MERFLKLMAIVFRFLVNKVGFVLLVGYVLAVYLGGVLKGARAFDVNSFKAFSSTGGLQDVLLDFVLLAMVCAFIYVLLSPKAFRKIFSPTVNMLGLILLAIIFFFTHPLALLILIGIALLIYILSLISGYGYVFELSGDSGPWKGRFMEEGEMHRNGLREKGGVILGISKQGKNNNQDFISFKGEGNVLVLAAAGKGKTSSIMANALVYNGSSVFNDPKGEITLRSVFSRANSLDQEIAIIDPFGECLKQVKAKLARIDRHIKKLSATNASAEVLKELVQARKFYEELLPCIDAQDGSMIKGINPMQYITALFLDGKYDEIYAEANILAESLVLKTDGQSEHWDERSRMIIRNAILFVTFSEAFEEGPKDLVTVRNFILKTFSSPELLDTMMAQCSTSIYSEYLEQIISEFTLIGGEELNGILSTTLKHTEFLDDPFVKKSVSRTDCDLSKLKHEKMTVYLVLPLNKTAAYGRLSRLWVSAILQSLTKDLFEPEERVLVVLDECASLGKVDLIEKGVSYLRQFGVNLYLVFQDLAQIKDIYGNRWETLATNCRFKQYLGVSDQSTAELLSKETGQKTLITKGSNVSESSSRGGGTNSTSKSQGYSTNVQAEPVMRPDELRRSTFQYIIPDEGFPIEAARLQYFNDSYLKAQLPFSLGADYKDI